MSSFPRSARLNLTNPPTHPDESKTGKIALEREVVQTDIGDLTNESFDVLWWN